MTEPDAGEEWEFSGYIEGTNIPVHRRKYEASIGPVDFESLVAEAHRRMSELFANERALPNYILDLPPYSMHEPKLYAIDIESPKPDPNVMPKSHTLFEQRLAQQVAGGRGLEEGNLLYIESKKESNSHIVEAIKALAGDEGDVTIHRPDNTQD